MEYFAFGETFVEEHRSSNNSPYKFNGKELDEETGWYYYGARYYDPRISVWLSVDPLANMDYIMNKEAYINGEHNAGIYNSFNHNSYGYCYQNPVIYVDPNGKQTKFDLWMWKTTVASQPNWSPANLPFDARGYELFSYWYNGLARVGGNLKYEGGKWGSYMQSNVYIKNMLKNNAYAIALEMDRLGQSTYNDLSSNTFSMEIENGYLSGYEMLHGTSNLSIHSIKGEKDGDGDYTFTFSLEWADKIDPNKNQGDNSLIKSYDEYHPFWDAEEDPEDFNINIKWEQKVNIKSDQVIESNPPEEGRRSRGRGL